MALTTFALFVCFCYYRGQSFGVIMDKKKRLAKLMYKDEILKMYSDGKTVRDICQNINYRLSHNIEARKTTLSKSTIHNIIKKYAQ